MIAAGPNEAVAVSVGSERARNTAEHAVVGDDTHVVSDVVMSLCRHMVADGFAPGCPEQLDSLAADADMVMTFSDGKTLETVLIFDATSGPRAIPYSKEQLIREGAKAAEFVGQVWAVVPPVRLSVWWVGRAPTAADLHASEVLPTGWRGEAGVVVSVWHISTDGKVHSSAPFHGALDDKRSIERWLAMSGVSVPDYEPEVPRVGLRAWPLLGLMMVAVFVLQQFLHEGPRDGFLGLNAPLARALGGADHSLFGEWFRLVTSTFVHQNLGHLVGNLLALGLCGSVCERFVGRWNTAAVFLMGGAAGALLAAAFALPGVVSVGASGGIAALWALGVAATLRQPHRRARVAAVGQLRLVGIFALLASVTGGLAAALAHVGGALAGVAWSAVASIRWTPRSQPTHLRLTALTLVSATTLGLWGVAELRARFHEETLGLAALEFLMADADVDRLRSATLATVGEAAAAFPSDPRVHYVHAHKLLDGEEFAASLEASARAVDALGETQLLFASGVLEGSIRQLRILAAEASATPGVIPYESGVLCGRLLDSDAGVWASDTGLCRE